MSSTAVCPTCGTQVAVYDARPGDFIVCEFCSRIGEYLGDQVLLLMDLDVWMTLGHQMRHDLMALQDRIRRAWKVG